MTLSFSDFGPHMLLDLGSAVEWTDLSQEEQREGKKDQSKCEFDNIEFDKFVTRPFLYILPPLSKKGKLSLLLAKSGIFYLEIPQPPPKYLS